MEPDKFKPHGVFDLSEKKPRQRASSLPIGRALAIMKSPSAAHVYNEEYRSSSSPTTPWSSMHDESVNTGMSEDGPSSATGGPEVHTTLDMEHAPAFALPQDAQEMTEATATDASETTTMLQPSGDQTPEAPSFSPITPGGQPTSSPTISSLSLAQPVIEHEDSSLVTSDQVIDVQGGTNVTYHPESLSKQPVVEDADDSTEVTSTQPIVNQEVTNVASPEASAPENAVTEGEGNIHDALPQSAIEEAGDNTHDASLQSTIEQASDINVSIDPDLTAARPDDMQEDGTIATSAVLTNGTENDSNVVAQSVTAQPVEEEGSTSTNPTESAVENGDDANVSKEPVATFRRSLRIAIVKSAAENQDDANSAPSNTTTPKKREAGRKNNDTKTTYSPSSTPQKRKAATQDPSADHDYDSNGDESPQSSPGIHVWPERSPAPESLPPPKRNRKSARLTLKKARKTPTPPPADPVQRQGTIDASLYPNSSLLQLPAEVLQKILDLVLIHPDAKATPKRKGPHRLLVEARRTHILTVGMGKITHPPVEGSKMKSNAVKDLNTASPTNLFLVCRALSYVGILTYYRKNTFTFDQEFDLSQWVKSLGSRRKFVKSVELKSSWNVFFRPNPDSENVDTNDSATTAISTLHPEALDMRGGGLLFTKTLRSLTDISTVNLTINANMPWSGRKPTIPVDSPLEVKAMCWDYTRKYIEFMLKDFRRTELDAPFIEMRSEIFFDWEWAEPHYPSFLARMIPDQSKEAVKIKRALLGLGDENAAESGDVEMQDE